MDESRTPSKRLLVCAVVDCLALAIWVGGLIVIIGAVIPAVFNSFGMEPGGRFLTRVFDGYNRLVLVAMAAMGGTIAVRGWMLQAGEQPGIMPGRAETILFGTMALMASLIIFVLGPQSVALQEVAFRTREENAHKAALDAFFRVHMIVRGLYIVNLVLGIGLLTVKLKSFLKKAA
ncbi:MAG: hypothetical protein A3H49_10130 [Nitrospirae bacterium RIFCSPLOWO2_02_FULL_62_14]|nr:MAG: hypothetical protein A3H49_10130 [Nitrospirae bacterium RIFCSPLOWO2_02_FULL_62_14]